MYRILKYLANKLILFKIFLNLAAKNRVFIDNFRLVQFFTFQPQMRT